MVKKDVGPAAVCRSSGGEEETDISVSNAKTVVCFLRPPMKG